MLLSNRRKMSKIGVGHRRALAKGLESAAHPFNCGRVGIEAQYSPRDKPYVENIFSPGVLIKKVEYTHNNPMNKGWNLVSDRADYRFSSACFYDRGQEPLIPVDDVRLLLV